MKVSTALISLTVLALAACASSDGEPRIRGAAQFADDPRLGEQVNKICFTSRFDGFSETTKDTAVIEVGRNHYLVETFGGCFNLDDALSIGLGNRTGCLHRGDRLYVSESVFPTRGFGSNGLERCTINSMYKWDPKAESPEAEDETEDTDDGIET